MIIELIISVFSFLILLVINKYSTCIALIICTYLAYCFVRYSSRTANQQIIAHRLSQLWVGISYLYKIIKNSYCFCRQVFSFRNIPVPTSVEQQNTQVCGDALTLENEINTLVQKISHFYLYSWYNKISENDDFMILLKSSIQDTLLRLCSSVSSTEKKHFSYIILQLYLHFFSHFLDVKKTTENFDLSTFQMKHWAMKDKSTEWCYLQSLVSALLDKYGPSEIANSLHSKYSSLLHTIVVEILTETLLQPLIRVLCDPSYINLLILKILLNELNINKTLTADPSPSIETAKTQPTIILSTENISEQSVELSSQILFSGPSMCSPIQTELVNSDYSTHEFNIENSEAISSLLSSGIKSSSNTFLSNHSFSDLKAKCDDSLIACNVNIKRSKSADFIRQMPQLKALNEKDYDIKLQKENNTMLVAVKFESISNCNIEQAEEAIEVEIPTLFTDVKITDTFQQIEDALLPYTLYCIQYSAFFHDIGNSSDTPQFVIRIVSIKRRFSEFVNLQSRIEDNPDLKHYLKGIKGPSKWLTLPFSNLDKKYIAERKVFLEGYLKELCSIAPIAHSAELQEFLAYGGDARISFVRRSGDVIVPRIDKYLARGVKGAIDMFKTALPISTAEIEGILPIKTSFEDASSPEQRFNEHLLDFSTREPEIEEHIKNYLQNSRENCSFDYVSLKWKTFDSKVRKSSLLRNLSNFKTDECCTCSGSHDNFLKEDYPFGTTIVELINMAIDFNAMNLGDLRTKLVFLFAPLINRFMISKIDSISEQHLANALHSLHQFLWPTEVNINKSSKCQENAATVNKIIECLDVLFSTSHFINNEIFSMKTTVLEKMKLFLLSVQYEEINKCLLFHMFDVVIEFLCSKE